MTDKGQYSEKRGKGFAYMNLFCKVVSHLHKKPLSLKTVTMLDRYVYNKISF